MLSKPLITVNPFISKRCNTLVGNQLMVVHIAFRCIYPVPFVKYLTSKCLFGGIISAGFITILRPFFFN
jgi:hypothetical protein